MATYRGTPIEYAVFNHKAQTYSLIGADESLLGELKEIEFQSFPNRRSIEVRNGRYRPAGSKDQRGANGKSGRTWRDDALDAFNYAYPGPGPAITNQRAGKGSSLTQSDLQSLMTLMAQNYMSANALGVWIGDIDLVPPKPALKRDGIVAGEIIGYRCWRLEKGWLRSVYQSDVWKPGNILAGRELGDWDSRGIHAWKDSASAHYRDYIRGYLNSQPSPFFVTAPERSGKWQPAMVTGTVFLWGDVVEHERGWRAEYARVRSLDWLYPDETMMGREQQTLDELRALYGVVA